MSFLSPFALYSSHINLWQTSKQTYGLAATTTTNNIDFNLLINHFSHDSLTISNTMNNTAYSLCVCVFRVDFFLHSLFRYYYLFLAYFTIWWCKNISILFQTQVLQAIIILVLGILFDINKPEQQRRAEKINNLLVAITVFTVVINVIISAFDIKDASNHMVMKQDTN